jgi:hypothetical protein
MKTLRLILLISAFQLLSFSAFSQATNRITIQLVLTNATSNNFALTLNGDTRVFTNVVTIPASQIITNHSIAGSASNLFNHIVASRFAGVDPYGYTNGSNTIYLRGRLGLAMSATILSNWATVSYSTQVFSSGVIDVRVPIETETATQGTNIASLLVRAIGNLATNGIRADATAMTNFVGKTNAATLSGAKTYINPTVSGGTNDGTVLTNIPRAEIDNAYIAIVYVASGTVSNTAIIHATSLSGILTALTNGQLWSVTITNATGIHGTLTTLTGGALTNARLEKIPTANITNLVTQSLIVTNDGSLSAILDNADNEGTSGLLFAFMGTNYWGFEVETNSFVIVDYATGNNLVSLTPAGLFLGDSGFPALMRSDTYVGTIKVATLQATNIVGSNYLSGRFASKAGTYTSLVNGNNAAIPTGTNAVLELSGGTTIAQIAGFAATGDGDEFEARFTGAITNWIVNEANSAFSTDATAANRIVTGTGGDITLTNQPAWARFRYRGTSSRWELKSHSR